MRKIRIAWPLVAALALQACDDGTGPPPPRPPGVTFGIPTDAFGSHAAKGPVGSQEAPWTSEFAVAVPDSLGGLVVLSYSEATSDLFILQVVEDEAGTYTCGPVTEGPECHARFFENVREVDGVVELDGRLDLVVGSLELHEVRPDAVLGSFTGELTRTSGTGPTSIEVTDGSIGVDLLAGPLASGGLTCLIDLATGGTPCGG